jgi:formate dehydrogenase (coenzyme F420) beta subunit
MKEIKMQTTETKMRDAAAKLFADKRVDLIIGFRSGSLPGTARPFIARGAQDVGSLVWNQHCTGNLATFLPGLFVKPQKPREDYAPPRIGIIAKGCDARSIAGLVKEKQAPRADLVIIGMPCSGMKAASMRGKGAGELLRACIECVSPTVQGADISIEGESRKAAKAVYSRVKEFEKKSAAQRWQIFTEEISRCIRCNACREACPNCYCKVCFADQHKPAWVSPAALLSDTMVYHLGRMFHQAGRCVECDACVNACPMGIDLRLFTQKLAADAKELFGCVPGVTGEEVPLLNTFRQDDGEGFITDPEEK